MKQNTQDHHLHRLRKSFKSSLPSSGKQPNSLRGSVTSASRPSYSSTSTSSLSSTKKRSHRKYSHLSLDERTRVNWERAQEHERYRLELIANHEPSFYDPDPEYRLANEPTKDWSGEQQRKRGLTRESQMAKPQVEEAFDPYEEPLWVRQMKMKDMPKMARFKCKVTRLLKGLLGGKTAQAAEVREKVFGDVFEEEEERRGDKDTRRACEWDRHVPKITRECDRWTLP